jgi:hypothetical protein
MNLNETVKWDKGHLQVTRVLVDVSWPAQSG